LAIVSELEGHVRELARQVVRDELARHAPAWEWLTVAQAADLLGVSQKAVRGKLARRVLVAHRLDGRLYVSRRELDEAIRKAPAA
jgi:excisionase family DNA binding protein